MSFDAEKEIAKLWKHLHAAQDQIGKTYYRWRQVAIDLAPDDAEPLDIGLHAAEVFGKDIGKSLLPRLNWLKGEQGFLLNLGRALAGLWNTDGGLAQADKGESSGDVYIKCTRDPWPTWAKQYGVPMKEVALCRERMLQSILEDIAVFFNIPLKIEMQKAIPRGEGLWLFKLSKDDA